MQEAKTAEEWIRLQMSKDRRIAPSFEELSGGRLRVFFPGRPGLGEFVTEGEELTMAPEGPEPVIPEPGPVVARSASREPSKGMAATSSGQQASGPGWPVWVIVGVLLVVGAAIWLGVRE